MSLSPIARLTACLLLGAMLAGCGGDDGSTPPPGGGGGGGGGGTPTPTPPSSEAPFGTLGVTGSQTYAVLGYSILGRDGDFGYDVNPASIDFDYPIGLHYAGGQAFDITLDGLTSRMSPNGGGATDSGGEPVSRSYDIAKGTAYLARIDFDNGEVLSHTGRGGWAISGGSSAYPVVLGEYLYGVPTSADAMPATGHVQFTGEAARGDFTVDFAARTVTGTLVRGAVGLEPFMLRNVAFDSADPSRFEGKLTLGGAERGTIEGQFTGPAAEEMMIGYTTTIADPGQASGTVLAAVRK